MIDRSRTALHCNVLALNRMYVAVHVVGVRRAFCLLCKGAAEVVDIEDGTWVAYDFDAWREVCELRAELGDFGDSEDWVRSVSFEIQVPRVIRLLRHDRIPTNTVKFTRRNVFLRDDYQCQYCCERFSPGRLSLDHVRPRSHGGPTTWDNIVTACLDCNVRKGNRTPEQARMRLIKPPVKPKRNPVLSHQVDTPRYECWKTFLD